MKLQCDLCREIVVADFAIAGGAITVHCPACKQRFDVRATRGDAPSSSRRVGEMTCPKCADAQPAAPACRSCGLLAERMPGFERSRDAAVPAAVSQAWEALEARWDDPAAHGRFLDEVAGAAAYAWAAQRYRGALRLRGDDPRATAALSRVVRMAEASLLVSTQRKPPPAPAPYRNVVILLVALIVLIGVGVAYALFATRPSDRSTPAAPMKQKKEAAPGAR